MLDLSCEPLYSLSLWENLALSLPKMLERFFFLSAAVLAGLALLLAGVAAAFEGVDGPSSVFAGVETVFAVVSLAGVEGVG